MRPFSSWKQIYLTSQPSATNLMVLSQPALGIGVVLTGLGKVCAILLLDHLLVKLQRPPVQRVLMHPEALDEIAVGALNDLRKPLVEVFVLGVEAGQRSGIMVVRYCSVEAANRVDVGAPCFLKRYYHQREPPPCAAPAVLSFSNREHCCSDCSPERDPWRSDRRCSLQPPTRPYRPCRQVES